MPTFIQALTLNIDAALPVFVADDLVILPIETSGNAASHRHIVWPNLDLPTLDYDTNPPFTTGFDNLPIYNPATSVSLNLTTSLVDRSPGFEADVIVVEEWPASDDFTTVSMKAAFFRTLRNYVVNKPDVGQYAIWEPRDRSVARYYVEMLSITPSRIPSYRPAAEFMEASVALAFKIVGPAP